MPSLDDLVSSIKAYDRLWEFYNRQCTSNLHQLGAFIRMQLGWSKDRPIAERKAIEKRALAMIEYGKKRKGAKPKDFAQFALEIETTLTGIEAYRLQEASNRKSEEALAEQLPVWEFVRDVKGVSSSSLARIVAAAGNLSKYATEGKLRKRLGIACIGGIRQGGLSKGALAEEWIEHGYSPRRRSIVWVIGSNLIKQNKGGVYRAFYDRRKKLEAQKAKAEGLRIVPANKIPKGERSKFRSLGHVHRRAQRAMEGRFIRDLYRTWLRMEREAAAVPAEPTRRAVRHPASPRVVNHDAVMA